MVLDEIWEVLNRSPDKGDHSLDECDYPPDDSNMDIKEDLMIMKEEQSLERLKEHRALFGDRVIAEREKMLELTKETFALMKERRRMWRDNTSGDSGEQA